MKENGLIKGHDDMHVKVQKKFPFPNLGEHSEQLEQYKVRKDYSSNEMLSDREKEEKALQQELMKCGTRFNDQYGFPIISEKDQENNDREQNECELENLLENPNIFIDFDEVKEPDDCWGEYDPGFVDSREQEENEVCKELEDLVQIDNLEAENWPDFSQETESESREIEESQVKELLAASTKSDGKEDVKMEGMVSTVRGPYDCALELLAEKDFRYLDSPNGSDQLAVFNERYWELVEDKQLDAMIYDFLTLQERKETDNISRYCGYVRNYLKLECQRRYACGLNRFTENDFNVINNRVVFRNCVFDIKEGTTYSFSNSLPYYMGVCTDYTEADGPTPVYDKLKNDATGGDEDSMEMIDLMIAYLMIPNQSAKCFFIMSYARDSGKSVLGHFIENLFDDGRVKTIDPAHLGSRFAFSGVENIVLMSCLEMSTDRLSKEEVAQFKKITGEKRIRSERKYGHEKTVPIRFKLLLASNGGLVLPAQVQDEAFYRRCIVIPFIKSTPVGQLMSNMPERLEQEKPYIVSKAVKKLKYYFNKEGCIQFPESKLSKKIKYSWGNQAHFEYEFIDLYLQFTGNSEDGIWKEDIYEKYQDFYMQSAKDCSNMVMLTSPELMRAIQNKFPGVRSKKMRRSGLHCEEKKNKACMTCLKWKPNERSE